MALQTVHDCYWYLLIAVRRINLVVRVDGKVTPHGLETLVIHSAREGGFLLVEGDCRMG